MNAQTFQLEMEFMVPHRTVVTVTAADEAEAKNVAKKAVFSGEFPVHSNWDKRTAPEVKDVWAVDMVEETEAA